MSFLLTLALAFVGARIHRYRRSNGQHIVGPQIGSDIKILSKFFAVGLPRFKALDGRTGLGIDVAEIGEFIGVVALENDDVDAQESRQRVRSHAVQAVVAAGQAHFKGRLEVRVLVADVRLDSVVLPHV